MVITVLMVQRQNKTTFDQPNTTKINDRFTTEVARDYFSDPSLPPFTIIEEIKSSVGLVTSHDVDKCTTLISQDVHRDGAPIVETSSPVIVAVYLFIQPVNHSVDMAAEARVAPFNILACLMYSARWPRKLFKSENVAYTQRGNR